MILRTRLSLYFHLYPLKARLAVLGLFLGVVVLLVGGGRLVSRLFAFCFLSLVFLALDLLYCTSTVSGPMKRAMAVKVEGVLLSEDEKVCS
jgi:hypothetical protein